MSTETPQPAASSLSSNVCSCADLAISNRELRLRCSQLEAEVASLKEQLAAALATVDAATAPAAAASTTAVSAPNNGIKAELEEDGELSVEDILRSTAQEMAREAAQTAGPPAVSLEEDLKAAAQEALGSQGYVYDERTGLYYDTNSGYYYDPTEQLFYNSSTGVYYTYDSASQQYVFHSRVALSELRQQAELLAVMSGLQHRPPDPASRRRAPDRAGMPAERPGSSERHSRKRRKRRSGSADLTGKVDEPAVNGKKFNDDASDSSGGRSRRKKKKSKKEKKNKKDRKSKTKDKRRKQRRDSFTEAAPAPESDDPYPPCIRMLVLESPCLPVGSLQIVTQDGATIGRDPAALPSLLLPGDPDVSKLHCRIEYSRPDRRFQAVDMASHTGTLIGGRPISERREISRPAALWHGCRLRIGGTEFLCHIHRHPGEAACSGCEPGLVRPQIAAAAEAVRDAPETAPPPLDRRAQLRQLKAKHGLLAPGAGSAPPAGYTDRAAARRREVGLDDSRQLAGDVDRSAASTAAASTEVALHERDASNPGVRLLARMGWRPGRGVGVGARAESALLEPLGAAPRLSDRAGLGSELDRPSGDSEADRRRARVAMVTRERYDQIGND